MFCSLAVLVPKGWPHHGFSPFISALCHSDWLFHGESCPRLDVVHPGRVCRYWLYTVTPLHVQHKYAYQKMHLTKILTVWGMGMEDFGVMWDFVGFPRVFLWVWDAHVDRNWCTKMVTQFSEQNWKLGSLGKVKQNSGIYNNWPNIYIKWL